MIGIEVSLPISLRRYAKRGQTFHLSNSHLARGAITLSSPELQKSALTVDSENSPC